jgi:cytochrome b pre-mRNA-processing protein 3
MPPLSLAQGEIEANMILDRLFRRKPAENIGRVLYDACVTQARTPQLYERFGAPDTVEGRFEIYTLHVVLLLDRLRRQGPRAADTAQGLFDSYLSSLDDALREMGVGDLSVGKKMRKLGEAFFGRVKNLEAAFDLLPATEGLEQVLGRTVYDGIDTAAVGDLSGYIVTQRSGLAQQDLDSLLAGQVQWSPV